MRGFETRLCARALCLGFACLLTALVVAAQAFAAEEPPYEFSAELSLTGGCGTSKADPIPDPGCPEKKPPKGFTSPRAIAIDSFGDEYVASFGAEEGKQGRIDIFSPKGIFITEVKDEAGPKALAIDSKGNLYVFGQRAGVPSTVTLYPPTVYKPGEEKIEYGPGKTIISESGPSVAGIAIDSNDHVFVDWEIEIREYGSAEEENKLLGSITNKRLFSSGFIALDKQRRRLYASSCPETITKCWMLVFNADKPKELLEEVKGTETAEGEFKSTKGWISVAADEDTGDFFVGDLELSKNVYQFNSKYELVSTLKQNPELFEGGEALQIAVSNAEGAFNDHYLFAPSLKNRALAYSLPAEPPAKVKSISVVGIGEEEAELLATIEPKGGEAHYVFEYLSQQEYEEAGETFAGAKVAGEGTIMPAEQEAEVSAAIGGLEPGTAYRFRVSAENGAGGETKQVTFTTYSDARITNACPQAIRNTYSTLLPDCRAYELVTPADTNGRPPRGIGFAGDQFNTLEASPQGEAVSFNTEGGIIPGSEGTGSFNGSLYLTTRTASGWSSASAGPTGAETVEANEGSTSPDQGFSFWTAGKEGSAVVEGEDTHYVRYPDGHSALVGRGSLGTDPRALGKLITENGTHIVFETNPLSATEQPIQLEPDAPPTGTQAIYDRTSNEVTHVVSLLPGSETQKGGENATYLGASADGEGIAFQIAGKLYLRVANTTTYEIGEGVEFAGVAEGGTSIFYVEGGDLFAFDTGNEKVIPFTETGNAVPVNVAPGGTRAYFVSTTAIGGAGENPNGASAEPGGQNLYLSEEGAIRFVGTVTERDVDGEKRADGQVDGLGLWTTALRVARLSKDPSRPTPDGSALLFSSRANLDGYAHEGVPELYRYDSVGNRLYCVSCIPSKVAGTGGANLESVARSQDSPEPFSGSGYVPNLRPDGKRAFFQSTEALVSRDNDGVQDVYEWEEQGIGSCTRPGGCVYLISSGHSAGPSYLYGVSASGNDVFFITADVLAGGDDSTLSIYDARVEGGFPEVREEPCQGESCKPDPTPAPPLVEPGVPALGADDNVTKPPARRCPKGKHKVKRNGRQVCVKNKKHHAKKKGRAGK